jgi:hypothetical protein
LLTDAGLVFRPTGLRNPSARRAVQRNFCEGIELASEGLRASLQARVMHVRSA